MITLKYSIAEDKKIEAEYPSSCKTIRDVALWLGNGVDLTKQFEEHFIILKNGDSASLDENVLPEDHVFFTPKITGGDNNATIRNVLQVAAIVALGALAPQLFVSPWAQTVFTTIASGLVAQALYSAFPPAALVESNVVGGDVASSQNFSINSQSNTVSRFGIVPKVYGRHKIFPRVAANPYVELLGGGKNYSQYLHCIYDFGLGPMNISDVKIGNTLLSDFQGVEAHFFDPNRPNIDEGDWDVGVSKDPTNYFGDNHSERIGIPLTANKVNNGDPSFFQVIRTTEDNPYFYPTKVIVDFTFPQGLISYASNGGVGTATVEHLIEYKPQGSSTWYKAHELQSYSSAYQAQFYAQTLKDSNGVISVSPTEFVTFGALTSHYFDGQYNVTKKVYDYYEDGLFSTKTDIDTLIYKKVLIPTNKFSHETFFFTGYKVFNSTYGYFSYSVRGPWDYIPSYSKIIYEYRNSNNTLVRVETAYSGTTERCIVTKASDSVLVITEATQDPLYYSVSFNLPTNEKNDIRVTRVNSSSTHSYSVSDTMLVDSITTRFDVSPIKTEKRHLFLDLKIKATNQLNGAIQDLSAVCSSVLDVYDGTSWVKRATGNPAWVFVDILTGQVNKKALSKTRLDLAGIKSWADFCDQVPTSSNVTQYTQPRFRTNFVLDFNDTAYQLSSKVLSIGQASINIVDGKYSVLVDKLKTIPSQLFTPKNSSNFSSNKVFTKEFHAVKLTFNNESEDFSSTEIVVYATGFNSATAEEIDDITLFGITTYEQAQRYGRFLLAQNRLRKEVVTIDVDFEYLACQRGDYVRLAHDVMRVGGVSARVKSVSLNQVTLDEGIVADPLKNYVCSIRRKDGFFDSNISLFIDADTFEIASGELPNKGDLVVIGETSKVYFDMIVKSIIPKNDLTATLTLIEKADAIYSAESNFELLPYNAGIAPELFSDKIPPQKPENLIASPVNWRCKNGDYEYYSLIDWDPPSNSAYDIFEVYADMGLGYNLIASTKNSFYEYVFSNSKLGVLYSFKIIAVSANGAKLNLSDVNSISVTPMVKTTKPSNVKNFYVDITNETLTLSWSILLDCDIKNYIIRYSIRDNATWEQTTPLAKTNNITTSFTTQARTGSYHIRAVDWNNIESEISNVVITSIPELSNLNIIAQTNDFPALLGERHNVESVTGGLTLTEYTTGLGATEYRPEGYYYYNSFLDLGDIYTVRLQSLIDAEGYTNDDVMSNWPTLSSVLALTSSGSSDWEVQTEYRATSSFNVIADWVTLDSVLFLDEGNPDNWTSWRPFTITDATGRIFQFRIKLKSNKPSVSPRVFDGIIKADMPDRVEAGNDITSLLGTTQVTYSFPFKGPTTSPSLSISINNGLSGDRFEFVSKTLDGFSIRFFDVNNNLVSRVFDYAAKGYGKKTSTVI